MAKQIPELTSIPTPVAGNETDIETVVAKQSTFATYKMTLAQIFTLGALSGGIKSALDALSALIAANTSSINGLTTNKLDKAGALRTGLTANGAVIVDDTGVETYLTGTSDQVIGFNVSGKPIATNPSQRISGEIRIWSTNTSPLGWFICDGSAISRTTYSLLFGIIGTTYGAGDGSTTFNIPNLKGRVIVSRDTGQTEFDTLGEIGGGKTHTLTIGEMPSHSHNIQLYNVGSSGLGIGPRNDLTTTPYTSVNSNTEGYGQAHNNLQPYMVLNYIIAT